MLWNSLSKRIAQQPLLVLFGAVMGNASPIKVRTTVKMHIYELIFSNDDLEFLLMG